MKSPRMASTALHRASFNYLYVLSHMHRGQYCKYIYQNIQEAVLWYNINCTLQQLLQGSNNNRNYISYNKHMCVCACVCVRACVTEGHRK